MATATATRMAKVELSAVTEIPTATKMAVFGDPDGNGIRLLGYMDIGFVPLGGTDDGSPITGVLELDITEYDEVLGFKFLEASSGQYRTVGFFNYSENDASLFGVLESDFVAGISYGSADSKSLSLQSYKPIIGKNSAISFADDLLSLSAGGNVDYKGIVGTAFFNKLNDPNAFAQLGDIGTGFNQATLSTPQAITASTPTVITLSGATEQENGDLDLLDISTNTITPIQQGDIITVDFAFPFETPIGSLQFGYVQIREKTTGFVVREYQHTYIKGAGLDDVLSGSFIIPIGSASYVTNGFEIVINSTAAIILSSKYLVVTRTHTKK